MNKIYVVGMGPGKEEFMTIQAREVLSSCDCIVGYTVYLDILPDSLKTKELISTPMRQEVKRCEMAYEEAMKGKKVAVICSGDAGVYGMASLMYELSERYPDVEIEVVAGITAALSGAAVLGAPVNHDFCIISLSDLLTPWEKIEKRLRAAAEGDFAIVLYNPSSHKRKDYLQKACDILLLRIEEERPCGLVRNIGRENTENKVLTLKELRDTEVDMFTTVFVGNSESRIINGRLITGRGYKIERDTDFCGND